MGVGLVVLADMFMPQTEESTLGRISGLFISWTAIVLAFALWLGFVNIVGVHLRQIYTRQPGAIYSIALLLSLLGTLGVGLLSGPNGDGSTFIFQFILQPLEATFFALLALFMATATFRAFRIRNFETTVFVIVAVIVLLGQAPIGIYLSSELPVVKEWLLDVPTLAGMRGILLGVALGTIATGLRVLIGVERPFKD
jgi:hypothetical protein